MSPTSAATVRIDERCTACGLCLVTCPDRALVPAPKRPMVLDDRCTACAACIEVCPVDAISEAALPRSPATQAAQTHPLR